MGKKSITTQTDLLNYALSQLGEGERVSNFDTDKSLEAQAGRDTYGGLLQEKLEEYRWQRFITTGALGQVGSSPYNDDWAYAYRYPSNCLDFHRILNGDRGGLQAPPTVYEIFNDTKGLLILTDEPSAQGEWTMDDPPITLWSPYFKTAFAFEWAALLAPRLLKQNGFKLQDRLGAIAQMKWMRAKAIDRRERQPDPKPKSRIQRARTGSITSPRFNDVPADS